MSFSPTLQMTLSESVPQEGMLMRRCRRMNPIEPPFLEELLIFRCPGALIRFAPIRSSGWYVLQQPEASWPPHILYP